MSKCEYHMMRDWNQSPGVDVWLLPWGWSFYKKLQNSELQFAAQITLISKAFFSGPVAS